MCSFLWLFGASLSSFAVFVQRKRCLTIEMVTLSPTPSCVLLPLFVQSEGIRKKCQRLFVLAGTFLTELRRPVCAGRFYVYYERLTRHTEPLFAEKSKHERNEINLQCDKVLSLLAFITVCNSNCFMATK